MALTKAAFYIGNDLPIVPTFFNTGSLKSGHLVQINPSSIKYNLSASAQQSNRVKDMILYQINAYLDSSVQETDTAVVISNVSESLSMTLYFDMISNAQNIGPGDDLMAGSGSKAAEAFKALKKACGKAWPIMFVWGKMKILGYLTQFSADFNYFSEEGSVQMAKVDVTITTSGDFSKNIADKVIMEINKHTDGVVGVSLDREKGKQEDLLRN